MRLRHSLAALFPNAGDVDRVQLSRDYGCNVASSETLDGLYDILSRWGVDRSQARKTIEQYERAVRLWDDEVQLDAPVGRAGPPPTPLVEGEGPFFAMEVQPSYVFLTPPSNG